MVKNRGMARALKEEFTNLVNQNVNLSKDLFTKNRHFISKLIKRNDENMTYPFPF